MEIDFSKSSFVKLIGTYVGMYSELQFEHIPIHSSIVFKEHEEYYYCSYQNVYLLKGFHNNNMKPNPNTLYVQYRDMEQCVIKVTNEYKAYLRKVKIERVVND